MHLVIYEGPGWKSLAPLTFSRPTFSLVCGVDTLLQKQLRYLQPTRLTLWVRPQLAEYVRRHVLPAIHCAALAHEVRINQPLDAGPAMLIDGATLLLAPPSAPSDATASVVAEGLTAMDALVGSRRWNEFAPKPHLPQPGKPITHLWHLLGENENALRADAARLPRGTPIPNGPWHLIQEDRIAIGEGVKLGPGCVIDASTGPIVLAAGAIIGANAVLQGPCFIGAKAEIMPVSLIRPGTSIGAQCKIGGEVSRSIMIGFSNKAHEGYLGDSYIGEWVNLGAGTTTSNLKNTYGNISVQLGSEEVETGRNFLGSLIGDHSKTAIGTRFMSGSYVGHCSMIATSAHAPRLTPSFRFSSDKRSEPYRLEKAFEVAKAMFARRGRPWTAEDESVMRYAAQAAAEAEGVT